MKVEWLTITDKPEFKTKFIGLTFNKTDNDTYKKYSLNIDLWVYFLIISWNKEK